MVPNAQIEKVGSAIYVVVAQRVGAPLRFQCETERDAQHFMAVFARANAVKDRSTA